MEHTLISDSPNAPDLILGFSGPKQTNKSLASRIKLATFSVIERFVDFQTRKIKPKFLCCNRKGHHKCFKRLKNLTLLYLVSLDD